MLMSLPPEVLDHICEKLHGRDLKNLSLTAKRLHKTTFRPLWRSITIEPPSSLERHCITPSNPPQSFLQPTRALHFDVGLESDFKHCVHAHDWLGYMGNWLSKEPLLHDTWEGRSDSFGFGGGRLVRVKYECLAQRTIAMLRRFEDGQLDTFSWNYTTCIPTEVLEYLSLKHPSIQSLDFTTDPFCSRFNRWSRTTDLNISAFRNIRRFSWKAPMGCHLDNIANLVQMNANHLEELQIDLQAWSRQWENREMRIVQQKSRPDECDRVTANTMLARKLFGLDPNIVAKTCFPRLRSLKLTRVPLSDESTRKTVSSASINLENLRHLSLRMCSYWASLFIDIPQFGPQLQLKSFEILDFYLKTLPETATKKATIITNFIDSFRGLEELFIGHCGPIPALEFWEHVAGHASTLKAFVHHQRLTDQDEELLGSRMGTDLPDLAISQDDRGRIKRDPSQNPLTRLNLEFIGLTCAPEYLRDILLPFVSKGSLKVLHIRQTGVNASASPSWILNKASDLRTTEAKSHGQSLNYTSRVDKDPDAHSEHDITKGLQDMSTVIEEKQDWNTLSLQQSFRDFADWVYGPEGITSLQYIVAGDLSHGSRYSENNVLIYRSTDQSRFRAICQQSGGEEWRNVKIRFGRALEACPVENIVPEYN